MKFLSNFAMNGYGLQSLLSNLELLASLVFCISAIATLFAMQRHWKRNVESKLKPSTTNATTLSADTAKSFPTSSVPYVFWLRKFRGRCRKLLPWTSQSGPVVEKSTFFQQRNSVPLYEAKLRKEIRVATYQRRMKHGSLLVAAFVLGYLVKAYRDQGFYPKVEEWRHVKVLQQLDRTAWEIRGNPVRNGVEQPEQVSRWNCCPDFPCETVIWPHFLMKEFRFQERGWCKSILDTGLGPKWATYPGTNDVVEVSETGIVKEKR